MEREVIEFDIIFHLNNVEEGEMLKYLSLLYGIKSDIIQMVNFSLYNFNSETYDLILSDAITPSMYRNKFSILYKFSTTLVS